MRCRLDVIGREADAVLFCLRDLIRLFKELRGILRCFYRVESGGCADGAFLKSRRFVPVIPKVAFLMSRLIVPDIPQPVPNIPKVLALVCG